MPLTIGFKYLSRNKQIQKSAEWGVPYWEIAEIWGLSVQRVSQIALEAGIKIPHPERKKRVAEERVWF